MITIAFGGIESPCPAASNVVVLQVPDLRVVIIAAEGVVKTQELGEILILGLAGKSTFRLFTKKPLPEVITMYSLSHSFKGG